MIVSTDFQLEIKFTLDLIEKSEICCGKWHDVNESSMFMNKNDHNLHLLSSETYFVQFIIDGNGELTVVFVSRTKISLCFCNGDSTCPNNLVVRDFDSSQTEINKIKRFKKIEIFFNGSASSLYHVLDFIGKDFISIIIGSLSNDYQYTKCIFDDIHY